LGFAHETLDAYRLALAFVAWSFELARRLIAEHACRKCRGGASEGHGRQTAEAPSPAASLCHRSGRETPSVALRRRFRAVDPRSLDLGDGVEVAVVVVQVGTRFEARRGDETVGGLPNGEAPLAAGAVLIAAV